MSWNYPPYYNFYPPAQPSASSGEFGHHVTSPIVQSTSGPEISTPRTTLSSSSGAVECTGDSRRQYTYNLKIINPKKSVCCGKVQTLREVFGPICLLLHSNLIPRTHVLVPFPGPICLLLHSSLIPRTHVPVPFPGPICLLLPGEVGRVRCEGMHPPLRAVLWRIAGFFGRI